MKNFIAVILMLALLNFYGCSTTTENAVNKTVTVLAKNKDSVSLATSKLVTLGLKKLAVKHPEDAELTAKLLASNAKLAADYFSGQDPQLAENAQNIIDILGDKVPDKAAAIINGAIAILELSIEIPSATTAVTPEQAMLIAAFLEGVVQGCEKFTAGN